MNAHKDTIRRDLDHMGRPEIDTRLVLAFMLCDGVDLGGIDRIGFAVEVANAVACIDSGSLDGANALAATYGL